MRTQLNFEQPCKYQDIVLSLGSEIAAAQSGGQLEKLLNGHSKKVVGHSGLYVLNEKGDELVHCLAEASEPGNQRPEPMFVDKIVFQRESEGVGSRKNFYDLEDLLHKGSIGVYLGTGHSCESRSGYIHHLVVGTAAIGVWVVLTAKSKESREMPGYFIKTIASLLTASILNIRSQEEIAKHKREREILQALNIDFATIREKKDLLRIIHFKLKSLFNFRHHWVATVNDDGLTMSTFMQDTESKTKTHPKYKQVTHAKYTIADRIFNRVILSGSPQVFDLEQLIVKDAIPEYLQINYESGIRKVVMQSLEIAGRFIGVWAICLGENDEVDHNCIDLVKDIANQFSIAVGNIIANETIQATRIEQELLLKLSYDITSARDREGLLRAIKLNLKNMFNFQRLSILIRNEKDDGPTLFLSTDPAFRLADTFHHSTKSFFIGYDDGYFKQIADANGPVVFSIKQTPDEKDGHEHVETVDNSSIRKRIGIALREEQQNLGAIYIDLERSDEHTARELEVIQGVSYQLCTAVANILANENIEKREHERDLLLSLSIDIAAVRSHSELLKVISHRLKYLLNFSHTIVTIINEDATVSRFLLDPDSRSTNHPGYTEAIQARFPIQDNIFDKCILTPDPILFNLGALMNSPNGDLPLYLKINYESGLKNAVVIRFSKSEQAFGFWILLFEHNIIFDRAKQDLIKGLSHQISVAVSNIIANEEISKREDEKTRLLAFSNALASVKTISEMSSFVSVQLSAWGITEVYCMHIINDDKLSHSLYLYDIDAQWTKFPKFKEIKMERYPVADGIMDEMIKAGGMMMHCLEEFNRPDQVPPYVQYWKAVGLTNIASVPVSLGKEVLGVLILKLPESFNSIPDQSSLLTSICSQIAIAVSNLSANEKVNRQLTEINQYKQRLEDEKIYLTEEITTTQNYGDIIGDSPAIKETFKLVSQVAMSGSTVLILGETGTGKELIARAIHNNSPRKNKLMVKVNCAALPPNLIESELFGHERGSFTGATGQRLGKFELAHKSTLFLDEIGEMPIDLQVKLLRALQEKEIERVGGTRTIKVDVRIVAATNRDLEKDVAEGRFRSDLYYRLNIFPIVLPPLRDRKEDIPLLAAYFVRQFAKKNGRQITTFGSTAMQHMVQYNWPGNVRELEHIIERCVLLSSGDTIKIIHLPSGKQVSPTSGIEETVLKTIDENERDHILRILKFCGGKLAGHGGAAQILDVPPGTLYSKLKRLGIKRAHSISS